LPPLVDYGEFGDTPIRWPEFSQRPPEWSQWNKGDPSDPWSFKP
jgi:hypothetical protein